MKLADLDLRDLFDFVPDGGVMRFAGERALILDAVALGLVRRTLIDTLGLSGARSILTQFGYAHGHRTASAMQRAFPWDSESEWRKAGGRLHRLQGIVIPEAVPGSREFVEDIWRDSYEAEQHLMHVGRSDAPVCWSQVGFASGYLTFANGREMYCVETRCRAMGDAVCHMICRPREEWGDELADHLPFYAKGRLDEALAHAADKLKRADRRLRARTQQLAAFRAEPEDAGVTARSPAMRAVLELADRVAHVDSTVLVTGESGVGKERIAHFIHGRSERANRTLVAINCGALPETLLESELFGNIKGAFTGATQDRPGLFEAANGGTLFLDEIGEVTPAVQVKLLRALQEHEIRRVGENTTRKVDVRIIAATNRNLVEEVRAGRFREDLYYRLRVIELEVPPLRERRDDIVPLARTLLAAIALRTKTKVTGFTPKAVEHLLRYPWPGNVRELENTIERAAVLTAGTRIDVGDLPAEVHTGSVTSLAPGETRTLAEVEQRYILAVLAAEDGNRTRTAAKLGIGAATLYRKLAAYGAAASSGK
ncbi:MAG TPA: sigma-54-dependent Fis family transcriptional regulator [Kofleriaceae bacterium]|nr:sigma-54-dependent Fis family transcriptional regulator [Kofleriaceae bacterium]